MEKLSNSEFSKNMIRIIKGSITSIILSIILLILFAIILTYTPLQENIINPIIIIITGISILVGSSISTLNIKRNGIFNGGLVGIIYILFLYLISSILCVNFKLNLYSIIMIFVSCLTGMLGGIIGVNLK